MESNQQDPFECNQEKTIPKPMALIIGLAFQIPGASDIKKLSTILQAKQLTKSSYSDQVTTIDNEFFNISPEEACQCSSVLGPLLEVVAECIMESGMPFKDVTRKRTGFYLQTNLANTYMDLTCKVAHYFDLTGPVVDFANLGISPSSALHTALLDLRTGTCDLAIVAGVSRHGLPHPRNESINGNNRHLQQDQITEGIAAILIKSPNIISTPLARVFCEIVSFDILTTQEQVSVKNDAVTFETNHQMSKAEVQLFQGESEVLNGKAMTKLPCSDQLQKMFKSSHPISALMGIISCISCMFRDECGILEANQKHWEDQVACVVCSDLKILKHQIVLKKKKAMTVNIDAAHVAAVVPTTVHPLANAEEAEAALKEYENDPGFLQFLSNSELSRGLKGPLPQLHYYFKIPGHSQFYKEDFTAYDEMPMIVVFEDFLLSPWEPSVDILNVPTVERSISLFDKILKDEDVSFSVSDILKSGNIPEPSLEGGVMTRVACQMAVVDLLTNINSMDEIDTIAASGIGSVAASYADGALTKTQVVKVSLAIEKLLCSAKGTLKEKLILDVLCSTDDVYQLGPWIQILCHLPFGGYRIAAPIQKRDNIIDMIALKGFVYKVYLIRIPVYSSAFRDSLDALGKYLDNIIPISSLWSSKVEIFRIIRKGRNPKKCNSDFFLEMLCTSFDGELENKKIFGLPYESYSDEAIPENCHMLKEAISEDEISLRNLILDSNEIQKSKKNMMQIIKNQAGLVSTPSKELDSNEMLIDCSTNAIRGSFLCPSIPTESVSSVTDLHSEDQSDSIKSEPTLKNSNILQAHLIEVDEKKDAPNVIYLHFFCTENGPRFIGNTCEEESSKPESSSAGWSNSTRGETDESVHMYMEASQGGLLESLAWLHGTGNGMESEKQFDDDLVKPTCYHGDFSMRSLWSWNRETSCGSRATAIRTENFDNDTKETVTMYTMSSKPRLKDTLLQALIKSRSMINPSGSAVEHKSSESLGKSPCAFDLCLLLLSGYKWDQHLNRVISICPSDICMEDLKMQKQVRFFSYDIQGSFEMHSNNEEQIARHDDWSLVNEPRLDLEYELSFANSGDLLAALNNIQTEEFNFVSMLQVDESLEKYLTDILFSFPFTSSLHVFITPKLSATSQSKYVINMSRDVCALPNGEEISVVLRDRSTDKTESCSSVTKALSIMYSFEDEHYSTCNLARVFELPLFLGDETVSFGHIEFMIFDKEMEVTRQARLDFDKGNYDLSSSTSSSSFEIEDIVEGFNDMSKYNCHIMVPKDNMTENVSGSRSQRGSTSKSENNSCSSTLEGMTTNFYLNLDDTFVKTVMKLARINKHTIAYIQPKFQNGISGNKDEDKKPLTTERNLEKCEAAKMSLLNDSLQMCSGRGTQELGSQPGNPVYMMSINEILGCQIFLYCKNSHHISRWESIKDIVYELKERHPEIQETHEVYVSKFDDEECSFEELLYAFMYDSSHQLLKANINGTNMDGQFMKSVEDKDGYVFIGQDRKDDHNGFSNYVNEQKLITPVKPAKDGFKIPQIVITPPENCAGRNQKTENESSPVEQSYVITCKDQLQLESQYEPQKMNDVNKTKITSSVDCNGNSTIPDASSNENMKNNVALTFECTSHLSKEVEDSVRTGHEKDCPHTLTTPTHSIILKSSTTHSSESVSASKNVHDGESSKFAEDSVLSPPSACPSEQGEENSDKENGRSCLQIETNKTLKALQTSRNEGFDFMAKYKVTKALVIHLSDKISSVHEQKGRAAGNLLLYIVKEIVNDEDECRSTFMGIVLFDDTDIRHSRFRIPNTIDDSNLESALNYLLAWYILKVLARVNKMNASKINALVQPPIQRDSAAIMIVASHLGCKKVISSSSLEDMREDLELMVPRGVVLDGGLNDLDVLPLVGKKGVDVIIMLRQQELCELLDLLAPSGCLVLCGEVDRTKDIKVSTIACNGQISMFDALTAIRYFTTMDQKERVGFEKDFYNLLLDEDSNLNDCFPSAKEGYFYRIIGHIPTTSLEEQPLESIIHDTFFSTTSTLQQILQSIPLRQRKAVSEIHHFMGFGAACDPDFDVLSNCC